MHPKLGQNFRAGECALTVEAGALSYGMGAGVGAAAATYLHRLFQNPADGTLQLTLNGVFYAGQPLPTLVAAAVIG